MTSILSPLNLWTQKLIKWTETWFLSRWINAVTPFANGYNMFNLGFHVHWQYSRWRRFRLATHLQMQLFIEDQKAEKEIYQSQDRFTNGNLQKEIYKGRFIKRDLQRATHQSKESPSSLLLLTAACASEIQPVGCHIKRFRRVLSCQRSQSACPL